MQLNFTIWLRFSILIATFIFMSCQDHQISPVTDLRFRVKTVTMQGDQQYSTDTYSYTINGKLNSISKAYTDRRKTSNREYFYKTVFQYDAQGRLSRIENQPDETGHGTVYPSSYIYEYDAKGNIVVIKYTLNSPDPSNNANSKTTFYLEYDSTKFPTRITVESDVFKDGWIYEYIYDKENVVTIKKSYHDYSGIKSVYTRTYQFDDKPNPFYSLYIGAPEPDMFTEYSYKLNTFYQSNTFNKNNMITTGLDYVYDSYGNLTKISDSASLLTAFEYETY